MNNTATIVQIFNSSGGGGEDYNIDEAGPLEKLHRSSGSQFNELEKREGGREGHTWNNIRLPGWMKREGVA